ncbi:hypothetical protein DICVIV_04141 [Dictyocaulus viviparus]|uniref:Uncharacterized protein n=1 Tax=Dictyocaulus viviparus TaxID=29172 RepID=A0A0D8XZ41_DICVI|nr:hypothetical protein DICVIV_04141 [Dictyocaulus viviparus]
MFFYASSNPYEMGFFDILFIISSILLIIMLAIWVCILCRLHIMQRNLPDGIELGYPVYAAQPPHVIYYRADPLERPNRMSSRTERDVHRSNPQTIRHQHYVANRMYPPLYVPYPSRTLCPYFHENYRVAPAPINVTP